MSWRQGISLGIVWGPLLVGGSGNVVPKDAAELRWGVWGSRAGNGSLGGERGAVGFKLSHVTNWKS